MKGKRPSIVGIFIGRHDFLGDGRCRTHHSLTLTSNYNPQETCPHAWAAISTSSKIALFYRDQLNAAIEPVYPQRTGLTKSPWYKQTDDTNRELVAIHVGFVYIGHIPSSSATARQAT
ncbi:hypothetical protein V8B55DRAFT_1032760 [Mucor lusitanicus]